jgi:hypothetical protein
MLSSFDHDIFEFLAGGLDLREVVWYSKETLKAPDSFLTALLSVFLAMPSPSFKVGCAPLAALHQKTVRLLLLPSLFLFQVVQILKELSEGIIVIVFLRSVLGSRGSSAEGKPGPIRCALHDLSALIFIVCELMAELLLLIFFLNEDDINKVRSELGEHSDNDHLHAGIIAHLKACAKRI